MFNILTVVIGAGDLASGVAYRLVQAGLPVVMTELQQPTMVRTTVSYGICVTHGAVIIEGIHARRAMIEEIPAFLDQSVIPVIIDPQGKSIRALKPAIVIDARIAKINLGVSLEDAPLVVALGPGFTAGVDCHAVVETNRGHRLGRVFWKGTAEPDTGIPGAVNGIEGKRVLRAPGNGIVWQRRVIGSKVRTGELLAEISGEMGDLPLYAPFDGVVRGLVDDETPVTTNMKIGDLDPRGQVENCFTLSDKSLAVGGGVVEAVFSAPQIRAILSGDLQPVGVKTKAAD